MTFRGHTVRVTAPNTLNPMVIVKHGDVLGKRSKNNRIHVRLVMYNITYVGTIEKITLSDARDGM